MHVINTVDSQPEEQAGVRHGERRQVLHGLEGSVQRVAPALVEVASACEVRGQGRPALHQLEQDRLEQVPLINFVVRIRDWDMYRQNFR